MSVGYPAVKALTVHQPWASLIITGHKDVENRTWPTEYRGRLAIHAGATADEDGLRRYGHLFDDPDSLPCKAVLGTVVLADVIRDSQSSWAEPGSYHWLLRDPQPFPEPLPARGHLSLWDWEPPPGVEVPA